jgi:ubiquinol-cytochrome c reductase cytochrome b subunit
MSLSFMLIALANGGNDIIATHFHLTINGIMWFTRIGLFVVPPIVFIITKRICLSLQRADREIVLHGRETGRLVMTPEGEFLEVHEELTPEQKWTLTQHAQPAPLQLASEDSQGTRSKSAGLKGKLRSRMSEANAEQIAAPTAAQARELEGGHH